MIRKSATPKTIIRWHGAKATIAKWIVSHFPNPLPKVYLESFLGSGAVLLAKPKSFIEIANDLDGFIVNVFKQLQENPKELAALLWATPYSAEDWRYHIPGVDELEDARVFLAKAFQVYCGNFKTATFAIDKCPRPHKPKSSTFADYFLRVLPVAARFREVQLLREDALKAISRVADEPDCLIYAEPPYVGHENEYEHRVEYQKLVELLNSVKGKVIVSEYATADDFWKGWRRVERDVCGRSASGAHGIVRTKTEVLYMNYNENGERL